MTIFTKGAPKGSIRSIFLTVWLLGAIFQGSWQMSHDICTSSQLQFVLDFPLGAHKARWSVTGCDPGNNSVVEAHQQSG